MNVKKYSANRRCYLTLEEYDKKEKKAEMRSVFWATAYAEIEKFERSTGQPFKDGIEITCRVKVRFHPVYGLNLDVYEIDIAHTLGQLELERQQTLDRLLSENAEHVKLVDGSYHTYNNRLPLPAVIQRIALITAPGSDGQRDFLQELSRNRHGYSFSVTEFLTTIQGEQAQRLIAEQLALIAGSGINYDAVAIVRGGGAQTDFKCFDDYALCRAIARFPIPVFTGIGHDRNQGIADLMAREQKTPTKVAATFVEHNNGFENKLIAARDRIQYAVQRRLNAAAEQLQQVKRIVKLASPEAILGRGFAIVRVNGNIVTDTSTVHVNDTMETQLRNEIIESIVTNKRNDDNRFNL